MANPGSLLLPSLILSFTVPTPSSSADTGASTTGSSNSYPDKGSTSDRSPFYFEKFLEGATDSTYAPTQSSASEGGKWEIAELTGGSINITVRATPRSGADKLVGNPRSVVIKYAPPFVAAIGEDAPFGTFRQVIEYRALSLLGSTPSVTSAEAAYGVTIPRVLKFFEDERVLVFQDLGEWMGPLDAWMQPPTATTIESLPSLERCSSVGTRLGNFLASIHCDTTLLLKAQTLTDDGRLWFENPDTKDLIRDETARKVLPTLRPWIDQEAGKIEKIARIISQDFDCGFLEILHSSSSPSPGIPRSMFSVGDLWTRSIIIDSSPTTPSSNPSFDPATEAELGLIDWEFTSLGRIGQDIAQLSAWLFLFSTSSVWSSTEPRFRSATVGAFAILPTSSASIGRFGTNSGVGFGHGIDAEGGAGPVKGEPPGWWSTAGTIMDGLLVAYAHKVKEYPDYVWFVDEDYDQHRLKKERLAVIRSIWILFGREVIYNSVEAGARFVGFFAVGGDGGESSDEVQMWQREMIEVGCWYVSVAGESSDEEFEEAVRRECVLKRMYTISGSL